VKYIYKPAGYHFRNRVHPDTQAHYSILASRNYAQIPTFRIIERLRKALFSRATMFATPNCFTLLNITNMLSGISYGYSPAPVNVLRFDASIAFTFAIRMDSDLKYSGEPVHQIKDSHDIRFWGYTNPKEFVTIHIDIADIFEEQLSIKDYEYLYIIIGSVTKNFAMFKDIENFNMTVDRNIVTSMYQTVYQLNLADLMFTVPYRQWIYNKAVWETAPEIIPPSSITPYSALYYAVFLSSKTLTTIYIHNMERCKHLLNELYKYYLHSQKMLISNQVGETNINEEHEFITSFIYPAAVYCIFHMLSVPGYREWKPRARLTNFYQWLEAMSVKMQEDLYINTDVQFLAQMPNLCKDAIINKFSTFRKAATILGEQSKHEIFTQH
jgi:hypothetical protein